MSAEGERCCVVVFEDGGWRRYVVVVVVVVEVFEVVFMRCGMGLMWVGEMSISVEEL